MENQNSTVNDNADRTITSVRVFNTTADKIFDAWTDPEKLAKWWGPKGFSSTFHEFNPEPGGHWRFTMHGPDGKNYPNESIYVEIGAEKIILDHVTWPKFRLTATFVPSGTQTKLTFRQEFDSINDYQKVKVFAVPSNEENFDRLEAVLGLV
jgi:uncharacterized protein YndB with AHSA1/START domain